MYHIQKQLMKYMRAHHGKHFDGLGISRMNSKTGMFLSRILMQLQTIRTLE